MLFFLSSFLLISFWFIICFFIFVPNLLRIIFFYIFCMFLCIIYMLMYFMMNLFFDINLLLHFMIFIFQFGFNMGFWYFIINLVLLSTFLLIMCFLCYWNLKYNLYFIFMF